MLCVLLLILNTCDSITTVPTLMISFKNIAGTIKNFNLKSK